MSIFDLKNKNILITGSYGYLGTPLSIGLAKAGAHVILNGRDEGKLKDLHNKIAKLGFDSSIAVFDVCEEEGVKKYFKANANMELSGLINNAASGIGGTILSAKSEDYRHSYEVIVIAASNLIKHAMKNFELAVDKNGHASIVNISSMYGLVVPHIEIYENAESTNPPFYGAAKAALVHLTKYAAVELAKKKIRVNSITPGPFPSESVQNDYAFIEKLNKLNPMNRIGQPEELVGATQFLLSNASSYITGINIPVDGGWTTW